MATKLGVKHVLIVLSGVILAAYVLNYLGYLSGVKRPMKEYGYAGAASDAVYVAPAEPDYFPEEVPVYEGYDAGGYDVGTGMDNGEGYAGDDLADKIW